MTKEMKEKLSCPKADNFSDIKSLGYINKKLGRVSKKLNRRLTNIYSPKLSRIWTLTIKDEIKSEPVQFNFYN